jgi:hypothetical protein
MGKPFAELSIIAVKTATGMSADKLVHWVGACPCYFEPDVPGDKERAIKACKADHPKGDFSCDKEHSGTAAPAC